MPASKEKNYLNIHDHSRTLGQLEYIYPVVSRRAGGVSVGINLNTNKACNWACSYCQVEGLSRGKPPPVKLEQLESELRDFLGQVLSGDFMERNVQEQDRTLMDIAFSGDGESTAAPEFAEVVRLVCEVAGQLFLESKKPAVPLRLITNGSFLHRPEVQQGINRLGKGINGVPGEVWFKLDRATPQGILLVNGSRQTPENALKKLRHCARLAPTWVQTCWFAQNGSLPSNLEQEAWLELVSSASDLLKGVHLYSLARASMQPAAPTLKNLTESELAVFAQKILERTRLPVQVSP